METMEENLDMTPCGGPLPELEVPMINSIVSCLGIEHRRLDKLNLQLGAAAARLEREPNTVAAFQQANEIWEEIRRDLWSHLQMEDGLILSWGRMHDATSDTTIDALKNEHQRLRELIAALPAWFSEAGRELPTTQDRSGVAQTLLALARTLDSHVEHYESEAFPSILRSLFRR
jgi:hemerythrin-like domain-containing protein